jgi:SagB-type dehydrogenase family enzyme
VPSLGDMTLAQTLMRRRSQIERFRGGPITVAQLSAILRFSYGPTDVRPVPDSPGEAARYRSAASAGGLYPLEIYPIVFDVEGCEPGLYHYSIVDNTLEVLRKGDMREEVLRRDLTPYREFATTCAAMFAVTAVFPRALSKYLFRGYRFISYDVGVLLQNLYLTGTALGVGTCAVGGFYDNDVGEFLGVDNVDENVLMMFCVGQPLSATEARGA